MQDIRLRRGQLTTRAASVLLALSSLYAPSAFAQTPPSTPSSPHERLAFFEGTWTTSDATPEDDFIETCAWLPEGRRHMVCRTRWKSAAGAREGMSIFSYDAAAGDYRYNGFRPGGAWISQRGLPTERGWQFTSERGEGAARVRTRIGIEPAASGEFRFRSETSTGDGPWTAGGDIVYRRISR